LMNIRPDKSLMVEMFLVGVKMSFVTLKLRSRSAVDIT
jgi:hypothetical protein